MGQMRASQKRGKSQLRRSTGTWTGYFDTDAKKYGAYDVFQGDQLHSVRRLHLHALGNCKPSTFSRLSPSTTSTCSVGWQVRTEAPGGEGGLEAAL